MSRFTWRDAIAIVIVLGTLALAVILGISAVTQLQAYAQQDRVQNALITKQADTIRKLRDQITDLGKKPVASAPSKSEIEKAIQGAEGPAGPAGQNATDEQVSEAVQDYCVAHGGCIGIPGQTGAAGPGPTSDQIAAAVSDFCAANGGCVGPAGSNGADGADGADGAPGADGAAGPAGPAGATYTPVSQTCIRNANGPGTTIETTWQNSITGEQVKTSYSALCVP